MEFAVVRMACLIIPTKLALVNILIFSKVPNFYKKKSQIAIKIVKVAILQTLQIVSHAIQTMLFLMVIALVRQTFQILTTEIKIVQVNNEF